MVLKDRKEFAFMLGTLATLFLNSKEDLSEEKVEVYWRTLAEFYIDDLRRAVNHFINTRTIKSFPLPGEFIEFLQGSVNQKALIAWGRVRQGITDNRSRDFRDPAAKLAVEALGGWGALGNQNINELNSFTWRAFVKFYVAYQEEHDRTKDKVLAPHTQKSLE